jgi:Icc-related predicted phosphoesterase
VEGFKVYGTPYQPEFFGWAFNRGDEDRVALFKKIPSDADVVICHGPPYQIHDRVLDGKSVGCKILRDEILNRVKPQLMLFGHIHEDHGVTKIGNTTFVNAASCTVRYKCTQKPVVIDLPRKKPQPEA